MVLYEVVMLWEVLGEAVVLLGWGLLLGEPHVLDHKCLGIFDFVKVDHRALRLGVSDLCTNSASSNLHWNRGLLCGSSRRSVPLGRDGKCRRAVLNRGRFSVDLLAGGLASALSRIR